MKASAAKAPPARKSPPCAGDCGNHIRPNNLWGMCSACVRARGVNLRTDGTITGVKQSELKRIRADFVKKHAPHHTPADFHVGRKQATWTDQRRSTRGLSRRTKIPCLTCGDDFMSAGKHNRICECCKNTEGWKSGNIGDFNSGSWSTHIGGAN